MKREPLTTGKALKAIRLHAKETQKEMAELLGVTVNYISLVENGQRGLSQQLIDSVTNYYGFDINLLLALDILERDPVHGMHPITAHRGLIGLDRG